MARRRFRGWTILWALLQFALPTAATYADALLERSGANGPTAHVESTSTESCVPVHSADCALCHLVHRVGTTSSVACLPDIAAFVAAPRAALGSVPASAERAGLALPRAPPLG